MDVKLIREFLDSIFGLIPENAFWYTWSIPEKTSQWHKGPGGIPEATNYLMTQPTKDLYYSLAISEKDRGPGRRHTMDQSTGIMCLWADIDIADSVHQKTNLPKSTEEALKLLEECTPLQPTWTIHSGHGLQVLWCFNEPWLFEDAVERKKAQDLVVAWIYNIRNHFRNKNYDVDATIDLARVFRIPGTINNKNSNEPIQVTVIDHDETARYEAEDFEMYISEKAWDDMKKRGTPTVNGVTGSYIIKPNAEPPSPQFQDLKDVNTDFKVVAENIVKVGKDGSQSCIDQSVANYCVMAGWSDQWIVDTMIYLRRKANKKPKLRKDYFDSTIALARSAYDADGNRIQRAAAAADLVSLGREGSTGQADNKRERAFTAFMKVIGVEKSLKRFIKYKSDPPQYDMIFAGGEIIHFETPADLCSIKNFRDRIVGATNQTFSTGLFIGKNKVMSWEEAIQQLLDVREDEDLDEASTDAGQMEIWLREYLESNGPEDSTDIVSVGIPLIINGKIRIKWKDFWLWVAARYGNDVKGVSETSRKATLKNMGGKNCNPYPIVTQGPGHELRKTSIRMWELPGDATDWLGGNINGRVETVRTARDREDDQAC